MQKHLTLEKFRLQMGGLHPSPGHALVGINLLHKSLMGIGIQCLFAIILAAI